MVDHLKQKGLEAEVQGVAPNTLNVDTYRGSHIPRDWEITGTLGDIIRAEYVDCDEDGEYINRGGILVDNKVSQYTWRIAKVLNVGPGCKTIKDGDTIMFPNDRGIPMTNVDGHNYIFLNEERVFAFVEPKKDK